MDLIAEKELMCKYLDSEIVNSKNFKYLFVNDLETQYELVRHSKISFASTLYSKNNTFLHKCVCLTKTYPQINEFLKEYLKTCQIINEKNSYGCTALIFAVVSSNCLSSDETVQILIDAGADLNVGCQYNWSPLHYAVYQLEKSSSINTISILLNSGANVNARTLGGNTALDYINSTNKEEIAMMLLEAGADISLCSNKSVIKEPKVKEYVKNKINNAVMTKGECIVCYLEDCNVLKCKFDHGICKECFMEQMDFNCSYCKNQICLNYPN